MGLAIADYPQGPYVKYKNNPVISGGHEVLVWPQGRGVATIIGVVGPDSLKRSIMYSDDGYHFKKTHNFTNKNVMWGPGAYRPEAFTDSFKGKMVKWGLHRTRINGIEHIGRYDLKEVKSLTK